MGKARIILRPTPMIRKQAGQMRKLLGLWDNSKVKSCQMGFTNKANPQPIATEGRPTFLLNNHGLNTTYITRRQIVLNRHFTEIISDVLANSMKKQLTDIGVDITSIETKAWNKGVSIFYSTNKQFDITIHKELNSIVGQLRSAISERQLIGRTPTIKFVYDEIAELGQNIEAVLKITKLEVSGIDNSLVESPLNQVKHAKSLNGKESEFIAKKFSAPDDMSNMILGLNYPHLYDEVAVKLESGRAQSARMLSNVSLTPLKPLFKGLIENVNEEDPARRIFQMQKFLIRQKKKSEFSAKLRRKQELLSRDEYKWDFPDKEENIDN